MIKLTPRERAALIQDHESGKPIVALMNKYWLSRDELEQVLAEDGRPRPSRAARVSADNIHAAYASGTPFVALMNRFGLDREDLNFILDRDQPDAVEAPSPQTIADRLPGDDRAEFLDRYRVTLDLIRDPAKFEILTKFLKVYEIYTRNRRSSVIQHAVDTMWQEILAKR